MKSTVQQGAVLLAPSPDSAKNLGSTTPGGHVTLSAKYAFFSTLVKAVYLSNTQNRLKMEMNVFPSNCNLVS